jgi:hypothetical protein
MRRASSQMRNFAECLIDLEATGNNSAPIETPNAFAVCEKLRPHLTMLMGNAGFSALLSRALTLAGAEVPGLSAAHVNSDGILEGVNELPVHLDADRLSEARVVLVAHLLGLMGGFIGENLTLRLVREVWPGARLSDLDLNKGVQK